MREGKKDEDVELTPFSNLEKTAVLQEARIFHDLNLNPRKCTMLLTKILYLIYQGEILATTEATEVFFAITKLFQSKDVALRRMVYLVIKELAKVAEDVIIVTSSLQKDMTAKTETVYRANAIRALAKITDPSMIAGVERFLKQAIVDKNPAVASAALVSALHLFNDNKEVVKRWVNEVQEACNNKASMVQYHALGLLYQIRQKDRMAVTKLVQAFGRGALRSPFAQCMHIRYAVKVMEEEDAGAGNRSMYDQLEACLRHRSEIVVFEAARAICNLPEVTSKELMPALAMLQLFLSSPKPTMRFAAIRTLNKAAMTHAYAVAACNLDMENLITDPNRSISTLAITTLLKTGNEGSVDRLMKTIEGFMSEITDEFKIVVVDAIRTLCLKFPSKQATMLHFLATNLRDDGGYDFKKAIVDTLMVFVAEIPDSREHAIACLCEFIEDCEFPELAVRILHMLGKEGPATINPSRCIRYIYNRVILENAVVRAAAVSSLAKFGVLLETLRPSITVLLKRCLNDNDDEVRDRATFYLTLLEKDLALSKTFITADTVYSVSALERTLATYLADPASGAQPFDVRTIPVIAAEQEMVERRKKDVFVEEAPAPSASAAAKATAGASAGAVGGDDRALEQRAEALAKVPELAALGPLLTSSKQIDLTETETEYNVSVIKHVFPEHVVFQYVCRNTLNDQLLENVSVAMVAEGDELRLERAVPIAQLKYDVVQSTYCVFRKPAGSYPSTTFTASLKFVIKDCDPDTHEPDDEGYDDEYALGNVELALGDYMLPHHVNVFKQAWDDLGEANEVTETFQLSTMTSLSNAVETVVEYLGMRPAERTGSVAPDKTTHTLLLSGNLMGVARILVRCRLVYSTATGVTMEMTVRSTDAEVSSVIASAIG